MLVKSHLQKHLLGEGRGDAIQIAAQINDDELMTDDCRECESDIKN